MKLVEQIFVLISHLKFLRLIFTGKKLLTISEKKNVKQSQGSRTINDNKNSWNKKNYNEIFYFSTNKSINIVFFSFLIYYKIEI